MIVRAPVPAERARLHYDRVSPLYDLNALLGAPASRQAIGVAAVREGEAVLELGVGTGRDLLELARRVGPSGRVSGLDLSRGMLRRARRRADAEGYLYRVALTIGDARRLPYPDVAFDVAFSSRLLDLVDTPDIPLILAECRRVLRPAGRLVLVNMSKRSETRTLFERLYERGLAGPLFLSRPVLAAPFLAALGFEGVRRVYRPGFPLGSEIAWARKPP